MLHNIGSSPARSQPIYQTRKRPCVVDNLIFPEKNKMANKVEWKKCRLLRAELVVLACLACFCIVRAGIARMEAAKADQAPPQGCEVTAIFRSEDSSSAVISDGTALREGDTIYGVKVVRIHGDKVIFEKGGRTWAQKVGEQRPSDWK
ncbi:MAG: hypothetical protein CEE38_04250 [Planctomycetes bacterium B3_Pla]|nr:MAG: hypothetical protein CEE38_04250 [Planctomycetes bacterium B3_Pla]